MKKYISHLFAGLLVLSFAACEDVVVVDSLDRAIVQAYLYAGSAVDDIRLTQPIPFGTDDDVTAPPINDATVVLKHRGESYVMELMPGDTGYYHYTGTDLQIEEGETYELEFEYQGNTVSAETQVPPPPKGMTISQTDLEIAPVTSRQQLQQLLQGEAIELNWDYEGEVYYYILVENTATEPEDIIQLQGGGGPGGGGGGRPGGGALARRFAFVSVPFQENTYSFQLPSLTQYGLHRAIVFRLNQEYVDLYETLEQDSRNLNEPLNNINNGLGVFAAFNSDTLWFDVRKP